MPARIWTPGAVTSGLMNSPAGPRDEKAAMTSPWPSCDCAGGERAGHAGCGGHERDEVGAVGQVDGRQPVVVGLDVGEGRVVQDHPGGAALEDVEALVDAGVGRRAGRRRSCRRRCRRGAGASHSASAVRRRADMTTGSGPDAGRDRRTLGRERGAVAADQASGSRRTRGSGSTPRPWSPTARGGWRWRRPARRCRPRRRRTRPRRRRRGRRARSGR